MELHQIESSFLQFAMNLEEKVLLDQGCIDRILSADKAEGRCNRGVVRSQEDDDLVLRMSTKPRAPNIKYWD